MKNGHSLANNISNFITAIVGVVQSLGLRVLLFTAKYKPQIY